VRVRERGTGTLTRIEDTAVIISCPSFTTKCAGRQMERHARRSYIMRNTSSVVYTISRELIIIIIITIEAIFELESIK